MSKVGFIGLGIMGAPMAGHLISAGHEVFLNSRSGVPTALTEAGGIACATPSDVAAQADTIFLMVPDTPHVDAVLFGDKGVVGSLSPGKTLVDMSSISPIATKDFAERIGKLGCDYIDAPVSGGEVGAKAGTLTIMCGGTELAFARVKPLFELMGKNITLVGDVGAGQICKVANQIIVALNIEAVSEALLFASKAGADPAKVRTALMGGFASSKILEVHGERMVLRPGLPHRAAPERSQPRAVERACDRREPAQHRDRPGTLQRVCRAWWGGVGPFCDGAGARDHGRSRSRLKQ